MSREKMLDALDVAECVLRRLAWFVVLVVLFLLARFARAADCDTSKPDRDLARGAALLASADPVRAHFGFLLMKAAAEEKRTVLAQCGRAEKWGEDAFEDAADPWDRQPKAQLLTLEEVREAAAVLNMDASKPAAVETALKKKLGLTP